MQVEQIEVVSLKAASSVARLSRSLTSGLVRPLMGQHPSATDETSKSLFPSFRGCMRPLSCSRGVWMDVSLCNFLRL